jgi:cell division protein FtsA
MSDFAEEILGMPVRIGYPTGVKGITQLVHGPQFATGVGLLKFGAQAMADAAARDAAPLALGPRSQRISGVVPAEAAVRADKSKFWEWIKAAF